jgi:2-dehydropantoate 2-reductase
MASVAFVGAGAIGLSFAAVLEEAGAHELVVCARRPLERVVVVHEESGSEAELRAPVITDPLTLAGPVEWLFLAVKAHQTAGAAAWLERLCGAYTRVVVLQNGVEQRQLVEPFARGAEIVPAIVWLPAEMVEPGRVLARGEAHLRVPDDEGGRALARLYEGTSARIEPVEDFLTESWRKLTGNAVAGLMVLAGRRAAMFRRDDVAELSRRFALECIAVARAEGAGLSDGLADELVENFRSYPPDLGTSILFDREAGRELEWDARNGVIQRLGAKHGVPTPVSDVVVPLLAAASGEAPQPS